MVIDRIEPLKEYPGMIRVWSNSTGWGIQENDLEAFKAHMDDWNDINKLITLTRKDFEEACSKRSIDFISDDDIGGYGCIYGDFGMSHYHTDPKNRLSGIKSTLIQKRYYGLLKENPNLEQDRQDVLIRKSEEIKLNKMRSTYPKDLEGWIVSVGGIDALYNMVVYIHTNNSHQLREEGRHFEWLIGHASCKLGIEASRKCEGYIPGTPENGWESIYPLSPQWWADWGCLDPLHPINQIAEMLKDRAIKPYEGKITYLGYGEDCDDDVNQNAKEWLGV